MFTRKKIPCQGDDVYEEGLTVTVILEDGTMDAERYIKDLLSSARKCWETIGLTNRMGLNLIHII
jgi:hypothetical protein